MSEAIKNTTRILFDMQACQTMDSAFRGRGNYSSALFEAIATISEPREIFALISNHLPVSYKPGKLNPKKIIEIDDLPECSLKQNHEGGGRDRLDDSLVTMRCQQIKPDIVHVSSIFEKSDRIGIFDPLHRTQGQVISATLYDLIPLIFQSQYLQDENVRRWYYSRLSWLYKADLLLAISETTKQDAINLLGIDSNRIVTIYGGASEKFLPPEDKTVARNRLLSRFPLREKIILYTGGDDFRKNIMVAIRAFAKIPCLLRSNAQLVINFAVVKEALDKYYEEVTQCGLNPEDVLFTSYVTDQELIDLYGICDVFIFPSLYEGLGLPILEAMSCGAPVIGGNNSSIRELIERSDALFDAQSVESIAELIIKVLTDQAFATSLCEYGLKRAKEFSWKHSASRALEAFDEALSKKREVGIKAAMMGILPRKRLAFLSPLPPCRTGIAQYSAQLLPFLARYFEIDLYVDGYQVQDEVLTSSFRIYDVQDFERVVGCYDLILYQFGNSEFHAHMVPLLEKYPGIVDLHDAYLSGFFLHLDLHFKDEGRYVREMLSSHAGDARNYLAPIKKWENPIELSLINLPCSKSVLNNAIGIIAHSPFNLEIARQNYLEGWSAPFRTIPQIMTLPRKTTYEERDYIRLTLGYQQNDLIIASFGSIVWTKCAEILVNAVQELNQKQDGNIFLIFAGQPSEDEFGEQFSEMIENSKLKDRIKVTGYLSPGDYINYLRIADLAVQLRRKSRGETSRAVLDCLAYGVPVIVNNYASYRDYPEDVVIKLDPTPSAISLTEKIQNLLSVPEALSGYSSRGRKYIEENHSSVKCSSVYAATLHEFMEKEKLLKDRTWVNTLAPLLVNSKDISKDSKLIHNWFNKRELHSFQRRKLFIDVTYIAKTDHGSGIQRVVNRIVEALYTGPFKGIEPRAVVLQDGVLYDAFNWLISRGLLLKQEAITNPSPIVFSKGDILLMLDSSWYFFSDFYDVFNQARRLKVPIITIVYDLLPINLSDNFNESMSKSFKNWFHNAIRMSDGLLCISRNVAGEVISYIETYFPEKESFNVGYFHPGVNFENIEYKDLVNDQILTLKEKSYLLVVGTIEPRKSHALILESMELLWKNGLEISLCIAGKEGWMVSDFMFNLRNHPELGRHLYFFENFKDNELSTLYKGALGLVSLSKGEGFGLPLIEAAHYGIPILCSDIPVFREIAGEFATYLKLGSVQNVSDDILNWIKLNERELLPNTKNMPKLSWEESAKQLMEVIINGNWLWSRNNYLNKTRREDINA